MKQEGHDFVDHSTPTKRETEKSNDPNVVSSQQEEDDIAKAIELSLKEKKYNGPTKATSSFINTSSSLYPSMSGVVGSTSNANSATSKTPEPRKVRALYDFEAAEDNELTFKAGEIIMVIEESDPNWWRGTNHRGEGYFPANFVTADLSAEPEDLMPKETKKSTKSNTSLNDDRRLDQPIEINEEAIDRLLFLLHEADPEDPSQDTDEMLRLENFVNQMSPLIDTELERVDRRHAQLTQLSSDLIDTINLYHSLMRDTEKISMGMSSHQMYRPNSSFTAVPYNVPFGGGAIGQMAQMPPEQMHPGFINMPSMSQISNQQIHSMPQQLQDMQQKYQQGNIMVGMQQSQMPSVIYHNNSTQDLAKANMQQGHPQNHSSMPSTFPQNHTLGIYFFARYN